MFQSPPTRYVQEDALRLWMLFPIRGSSSKGCNLLTITGGFNPSQTYLAGGFNPSEKYESQLGWLFPTEWENNPVMFQSPPTSLLITINPLFIHHYTTINHYKSL